MWLLLLQIAHLQRLKIQNVTFTVFNSTLKFVTLYTVTDILRNFALKFVVLKVIGQWRASLTCKLKKSVEQVGDKKVLLGLSGGVDSSVVGVLLQRAIGDQLTSIFVDHGFLRKGEGDQVMNMLGDKFGLNIIRVNAEERFMTKLAGVSDPEKKRKIIGNEFVYVFDDEASKLKDVKFLAQGTLYTDVIESGTDTAQTIKSHHNVGGLARRHAVRID